MKFILMGSETYGCFARIAQVLSKFRFSLNSYNDIFKHRYKNVSCIKMKLIFNLLH